VSTEWIVVTGASRGIGRAAATRLADDGHGVVLWARSAADLAAADARITAAGGRVRRHVVDVGDADSVARATRELRDIGPLRAVIVNAGGAARWASFLDLTSAEWRATMATNIDGAVNVLRALLPALVEHGRGQVVVLGSDSALYPFPGRAHYCTTKAGVYALAETVRAEFREHGIRVTVVLPSRVDTHFGGRSPGDRPRALSADDIARVIQMIIALPPQVEVRELRLSSLAESYGPF
jgi:serine 3-dehydrogenase